MLRPYIKPKEKRKKGKKKKKESNLKRVANAKNQKETE
jgi:hypothetical protein